jgi:hypothetical protein
MDKMDRYEKFSLADCNGPPENGRLDPLLGDRDIFGVRNLKDGRALKPLAIDLFSGLGGWAEGLLEAGFYVVGFDNVRHVYGEHRYPAQLVIQDVLTLHGSQFKDAALIVASPPCQEYSYMAMPWKRAKQIAAEYRDGTRDVKDLTRLFDACFRIQREASGAAGHHIPLVVENVRGAQPWVGRSRWNFGSYHLWGDVPALMPMVKVVAKRPGHDWNRFKQTGEVSPHWRLNGEDSLEVNQAIKNSGGSWFRVCNGATVCGNDPRDEHRKQGGDWFREAGISQHASKSSKRKVASAMIAKIPFTLAAHIARTYYPKGEHLFPLRAT